MSGPCCNYCGQHCFVLREIPTDAIRWGGHTIHLATCRLGKFHDLEGIGYDADTAINPFIGEVSA